MSSARLYTSPYAPPDFFAGVLQPSSMPHSSKQSQPPSGIHRSSFAGRKRKRHTRQPPATQSSSSLARQQSIPDVFSSQRKTSSLKDNSELSSSSKRRKQDSSPSTPRSQAPPKRLAAAEMYNLPQKISPQGAKYVDLTTSPEGSPSPRRTNGFQVSKGPAGSHATTGKLVVKNLGSPFETNPDDYLEQVWSKLDAALDLIFSEGKVTFPSEQLHRGVENVCRQGHPSASVIHIRLKVRCKKNITDFLKAPLVEKTSEKDADVLRAVIAAWTRWKTQMVRSSRCSSRPRISLELKSSYRSRCNRFSSTWIALISFNHQSLHYEKWRSNYSDPIFSMIPRFNLRSLLAPVTSSPQIEPRNL